MLRSLLLGIAFSGFWCSAAVTIVDVAGTSPADRWIACGEIRELIVISDDGTVPQSVVWSTTSQRLTILRQNGAHVTVQSGSNVSKVPGSGFWSRLLGQEPAEFEAIGEELRVSVGSEQASTSLRLIVYKLTLTPDSVGVPTGEARKELEPMFRFLNKPPNGVYLAFLPKALYAHLTYDVADTTVATVTPAQLARSAQWLLFDSPLQDGKSTFRCYLGGHIRLEVPITVHSRLWELSYWIVEKP